MASLDSSSLRIGAKLFVVGIIWFYFTFRLISLTKKTSDLAVSKIRSLAVGPVRIKGKVGKKHPKNVNISPILKEDCVLYSNSIDEYYFWGYLHGWREICNLGYWDNFYLEDNTGKVLVSPDEVRYMFKPSYKNKLFFFFKKPDKQEELLLKRRNINYKKKSLKILEYVLKEGDEVEIIGYAKPVNKVGSKKQEEKLEIVNTQDEDMTIKKGKESIFSSKKIIFYFLVSVAFFSGGLTMLLSGIFLMSDKPGLLIGLLVVIILVSSISFISYFKTKKNNNL